MNEFLSFTAIPNKVILFTNKEETPVLFRGLTAHFREKIEVNFAYFIIKNCNSVC